MLYGELPKDASFILDKINDINKQIELAKQSLEFQKDSLLEILKTIPIGHKDIKEIISILYWSEVIPPTKLASAFNLTLHTIRTYITPINSNIKCEHCGTDLYAESISALEALNAKHHYSDWHLCKQCKEEDRKKINELNSFKNSLAELVRQANINELKRMSYKEYLQTNEWNDIKQKKLKQAGYRCQVCNKNDIELNVHHRTYENRGNEHFSDLIVLCKDCHSLYHLGDTYNVQKD